MNTSDQEIRTVDWQRFAGDFANHAQVPASGLPTIGIAGDVCDCCGRRRVIIAAIHPNGAEVSIAVDEATALEIANAIIDAYGKGRQ